MHFLRLLALLLILLSTPMFILGILGNSALLWAGSLVVWGAGLLGYAVGRMADKAKK